MKKPVKNATVSSRRVFLQSALIGSVAACVYPALGAARVAETSPARNSPEVPAFELEEVTIDQLQADMKSGKHTARSLTEKYLQRIQNVDKHGPAVNSVIEINPDALQIA